MIKKLNNRGMSAIEILVCFVLMAILSVSMYNSITSYKNKQSIEAAKEKIVTYKNLLTREIQDDLIKKGLVSAEILEGGSDVGGILTDKTFKVDMLFRDGSKKRLVVKRNLADDYSVDSSSCVNRGKDDEFLIRYGVLHDPPADPTTDPEQDLVNYPLPNVGYGKNNCEGDVLDLRINNVDINKDNNILTIYIGFYHPDFGTKYGINIVCPINYF